MLIANSWLLLRHRCHFIVSIWKWSAQSGRCNFSHIVSVFGQVLFFTEVIHCFNMQFFFFYSYHRRKKILKCVFKIKRLLLRFSKGWKGLLNTLSIIRTWVNPTTGVTVATHALCSVQSLGRIWLFVTPWAAACQASLSITNSWSLLKLMSIESVMPSNHLILYHPPLLLPSILHRL